MKSVKRVPRHSASSDANVISSHVLYMIKINDDSTLSLKARVDLHGNEIGVKTNMQSDCCMLPSERILVIFCIIPTKEWNIVKGDVRFVFLHSRQAEREVLVIPPRKFSYKNELWPLLAAVYGLVNSSTEWKVQSDSDLLLLGLERIPEIDQLFIVESAERGLQEMLIRVVDDILTV